MGAGVAVGAGVGVGVGVAVGSATSTMPPALAGLVAVGRAVELVGAGDLTVAAVGLLCLALATGVLLGIGVIGVGVSECVAMGLRPAIVGRAAGSLVCVAGGVSEAPQAIAPASAATSMMAAMIFIRILRWCGFWKMPGRAGYGKSWAIAR